VLHIFCASAKVAENSLSEWKWVLRSAVHREMSYWKCSFIKQLTVEVLEEGADHSPLHKPDAGVLNELHHGEVSEAVRLLQRNQKAKHYSLNLLLKTFSIMPTGKGK
jgi:hypothetical protein